MAATRKRSRRGLSAKILIMIVHLPKRWKMVNSSFNYNIGNRDYTGCRMQKKPAGAGFLLFTFLVVGRRSPSVGPIGSGAQWRFCAGNADENIPSQEEGKSPVEFGPSGKRSTYVVEDVICRAGQA